MNKRTTKIFSILALVISAFFAEKFIQNDYKNKSNIEEIIKGRQSGEIVNFEARVVKLLQDDLKGDKHQKLIMKTGSYTLLLAHNIDIAPRVPVKKGDKIIVQGKYEWNKQGGLVHWTHRSNNEHPAGWINHKNIKYH
jgi:hypothetical protein